MSLADDFRELADRFRRIATSPHPDESGEFVDAAAYGGQLVRRAGEEAGITLSDEIEWPDLRLGLTDESNEAWMWCFLDFVHNSGFPLPDRADFPEPAFPADYVDRRAAELCEEAARWLAEQIENPPDRGELFDILMHKLAELKVYVENSSEGSLLDGCATLLLQIEQCARDAHIACPIRLEERKGREILWWYVPSGEACEGLRIDEDAQDGVSREVWFGRLARARTDILRHIQIWQDVLPIWRSELEPDTDALARTISGQKTLSAATATQYTIPPGVRTRPMSKSEAARYMGYKGGPKRKAAQITAGMEKGTIPNEKINRQSYVFDIRSFPADCHHKVRTQST
ncbi:MAG: hypothetical protein GX575_31985 [Candidatus Anammoximicrobium sp.]|mgnify:CR=1 FL=1|nr:hypothetical protein [Candidatus Anammoximicrobium sp.]